MRPIELPRTPSGHSAPITHVAFRADGNRLASSSYDGTVIVWDVTDPAAPARLARLKHRRLVNASAWNPGAPDVLATASADKTVAVWRLSEQGGAQLVSVLARHTDDINSVAWLPDGERLICVSEDGRATMWDALQGRFLAEVGSHEAHCMMVSVSRDGLVATVGEDGVVAVSDPDEAGRQASRSYDASVEGCAWSNSGQTLAIARDDGAVDLLTAELEHVRTVDVSTSAARCVSWSEDDSRFVVGAYDGSLHFFDTEGQRLHRVDDARFWPRSVAAARGLVAAGSFWSTPHLLSFDTASEIAGPAEPTHGPNALATSDGELFVGCDSGTVLAVSLVGDLDKPSVRRLPVTDGPVLSLAVRDDVVYAGTYAGHVIRFDGEGVVSDQLGAPLPSLAFDGDVLVAGTYNGELVALDPGTLAVQERRAAHSGSVKALAPLEAGGFLSAATDRTIAGGGLRERTVLWEHGNLVNSVAALGDAVAASAARDHTVKVGKLTRRDGALRVEALQTLLGPDESVKCVALLGSASAPWVLAGSYDFGLYAWPVTWSAGPEELTSGHVVAEFGQGLSCMLQLDDTRVVVAGWDGRLVIVERGADDEKPRVTSSWAVQELMAGDAARRRG